MSKKARNEMFKAVHAAAAGGDIEEEKDPYEEEPDGDADDEAGGKKPKNFIKGAIKHPGALHEQLGIPKGEKIPEATLDKAAKAGGKLGQRARFAKTLKGFHK